MVDINKINPVVSFIYFFSIVCISMFVNNIVISLVSVAVSLIYYFILQFKIQKAIIAFAFFIFFSIIVLNMLWNHRGSTILFFINNQAITFEAFYYGLTFAMMVVSSVFWFRLISKLFTSDKLLYIFNSFSPKIALLLSISIRFVDMYIEKFKSIDEAVKGIGLYKDYSIIDIIKTKSFVFSALVTWALENGIITSDSMVSRGFGLCKRTSFYVYNFDIKDKILLLFIIVIDLLNVIIIYMGGLDVVFYPKVMMNLNPNVFIPFFALVFLFLILILIWRVRWHYMMLKI